MPSIVTYTAYLEGSLTLTSEGEWLHEGRKITHDRIVNLFHRSIVWNSETQRYRLEIGREIATFTCEDTPYFIQNLYAEGKTLCAELLSGKTYPITPAELLIGAEDQLYASIDGRHRARLLRGVHQQAILAARSEQELNLEGISVQLRREER